MSRAADPQTVGMVGAAVLLNVAEMQEVGAVRFESRPNHRIGVVSNQPGPLVFVVVVDGQLPAVGVGEPEHRIQWGAEPSGANFGHDHLPGTALEAEYVPVVGRVDPAVDDRRQLDLLRTFRRIVRLPFE